MTLAAKLDSFGPAAWIGLMILGFIAFWPLGLAVLAYMLWSGRMGCWRNGDSQNWRQHRDAWRAKWHGQWQGHMSSGNAAFDEYKAETLKRLEEEQKAFTDFLDRLRKSKDKAEFDAFMNERRNGGAEPQSA